MRIYLDTNVPSYAFAPGKDVPAAKVDASEALMSLIRRGLYEAVIGPVVTAELQDIPDPQRHQKIIRELRRSGVRTLPLDLEARATELCQSYLKNGAVRERHKVDALHAAWASLAGAQVLVTWNRHSVAKWKARQIIGILNRQWGLEPLLILKPVEVLGEAGQEDA